ncbi:MAG: hypothetical protein ACK51J_01955 [Burkholderiales bacterium]|jgi:hypothetical protein
MDAADVVFWLCVSLNLGVAGALAVYLRGRVKAQLFSAEQAKRVYSWLCLGASILSGVVVFLGIVALFHIPVGHGEILVATPLFNLLFAGVLIIAGRIGIGWVPMRW